MPASPDQPSSPVRPDNLASGRYTIFGEIASGGMATIRYGRLVGALGFSRAVVVKQLHPQFAKDENFVSMILDEARLSARISHANVVQTIDVLSEPGELSIVMEYVHGESLGRVLEHIRKQRGVAPVRICATLVAGILHGLHAAHETRGEHGEPLHIVHRDVSPENILVGSDGIARLIDFGVARAQGRSRITPAGELKGKLAYMAVEQYRGEQVDRRVDVYGASVVLWETLTGRDLFKGDSDAAVVGAVMNDEVRPPSEFAEGISAALDAVVMQGISRDRTLRFATAREMALALERSVGLASQSEVSDWLESVAGELLLQRTELLRRMQMNADVADNLDTLGPAVTRRLDGRTATPQAFDATVPDADFYPGARTEVRPTIVQPPAGLGARKWGLLVLLAVGGAAAGLWSLQHGGHSSPAPAARPVGETVRASAPVRVETPAQIAAPVQVSPPWQAADAAMLEVKPVADVARSLPAVDSEVPVPAPSVAQPVLSEPRPKLRQTRSKPKPARASATPSVDCAQPFWLDARGIRHVKRECLD